MKKYFMPENNATYLKDKDASKCTPFTGIKNKQKTYAHQKVSAVCSMHSCIFEFFRHAGMRQMVTQYQEYYILSYTLTNWPSIAVIWINMHAWKITHDVHLFSLLAPQQVWLGNSKQVKIFKDLFQRYNFKT